MGDDGDGGRNREEGITLLVVDIFDLRSYSMLTYSNFLPTRVFVTLSSPSRSLLLLRLCECDAAFALLPPYSFLLSL